MNNKSRPIEERFWEKVDTSSDCWLWGASKYKAGYGCFTIKKGGKWVNYRAHRFAYELLVGVIPSDKELDHLCRSRACVNPKHLEVVTHRVNCQRGDGGAKVAEINKAKTHCTRGHPYNEANTYINGKGARMCRICRNNWRKIKSFNQLSSPLVH